jgi:hypothetical protein
MLLSSIFVGFHFFQMIATRANTRPCFSGPTFSIAPTRPTNIQLTSLVSSGSESGRRLKYFWIKSSGRGLSGFSVSHFERPSTVFKSSEIVPLGS